MKGHHQAFPPPSGLRFLTDYEQYMDFSHYMGKGLQQQGDSSTHFKDLSGALGPRFQVFFFRISAKPEAAGRSRSHEVNSFNVAGLNDWALKPINPSSIIPSSCKRRYVK